LNTTKNTMFDFNGNYSSLFLLQAVQLKQNRASSMSEAQYFRAKSRAIRGGWIGRALARLAGAWTRDGDSGKTLGTPAVAATQPLTTPRLRRTGGSFARAGADGAAFAKPPAVTDRAA
jgi:hypothetical protein